MDIKKYISALKHADRITLYYYAIDNGVGMNVYTHKFLKDFNISSREFERASDKLTKDKVIYRYGWYPTTYKVEDELRIEILKHLIEKDRLATKSFEKIYKAKPEVLNFLLLVKYALTGKESPLMQKMESDIVPSLTPYYSEGWITRALEYIDDDALMKFVDTVTFIATIKGILIPKAELDRITKTDKRSPICKETVEGIKTLYLYLAYGIYDLQEVPTTRQPWQITTAAIRRALQGDYEGAITLFNAALKILNRSTSHKNFYVDLLPQYFLVMSYLHLDNETSLTKLSQFIKKKDINNYGALRVPILLAETYINNKKLPVYASTNITNFLKGTYKGECAMTIVLFGILLSKYYRLGLWEKPIPMPTYAIMRHELSEYLDLPEEERLALRKAYGDMPILTSIRFKEDWELLIDDVIKTVNQTVPGIVEPGVEAKQENRLIYVRKYGEHFEPKYQSTLKSGGWSKPKNVAVSRFYECELDYMTDLDRTLGRLMKPDYYSYDSDSDTAQSIMPYLVGSDRVFNVDSMGQTTPIDIIEVKPQLEVKQTPEGYKVVSNVTAEGLRKISKGCVTVRIDANTYHVMPIEENQRDIYAKMIKAPVFPLDSKLLLQKFLVRLDEVVDIKSNLLDRSEVRTIDGSAFIAIKAAPAPGSVYNIGIYAKPLAEGSVYCLPGTGRPVVYDTLETENVRIKRDMKAEVANYHEVIDVLDTSENPMADGDFSSSIEVEQMLDLLDFARQNPDKIIIEWPEGKQITLRNPLGTGSWNVGIKQNNGWFEVEGDVKIDDNTVVKMTQLLEIIAEDKGRFVRLGENDFVEIDKKLRRQLERIEALAVKNHNKLQISNFNAALLDKSVLDGEIKISVDQSLKALQQRIKDSENLDVKVPKNLQATLRPYQVDGYQWMSRLAAWGAGACLADDMGLGKTVQTIAFLLTKAKEGPALIVAPASVVPNWRNELERFSPSLHVEILNKVDDRKKTIKDAKKGCVVLTTYGLLNTEEDLLAEKKWVTVCLDEAHTIKNRETKMSQAAMKLKAEYRIALTGTPIQNHLGELWNLFRFLNPGLLGSHDLFRHKFVIPISQDNDKERRRQLQRIIKPFMLRRTKNEVVDDLPEKTDIVLSVELTDDEMALYEAIRKKAVEALEEATTLDVNTLAEITKLRRAACAVSLIDSDWFGTNSKVQTFLELVRDFKGDNNRMLVFSQFTSFLDIVRKALDDAGEKYLYLDGSTSMKQRERLVEEFNNGDCPLFLISLKAGGLGLNLTGANYVVHLDPWWNPAIEQQATDRAYRIGQQRNVTVYHLLSKNTIEEKIRRLHQTKRDLADSLLEGSDMASKLTVADVLDLINGQE